ncbi:glycosyltransferase family 2 protein [Methanobacterium sp. SMA-27]|uniref:glycosyltransferase family 2 protein n=1 Tax=Methanobacterium sp. SMA-27 TaxID=1495336 RepID=UPI00064F772C|nr:glycosyltransferase family 2 protein [Methanobacterium sp. SMA-27]
MENPKVAIVILNWNGWKDTIECLESIYQINYPNYRVVIVDNNSSDDSIQKIKDYSMGKLEIKSKFFENNPDNKPIEVIEDNEFEITDFNNDNNLILLKNDINYGFAEGNNIGIRFALKMFHPDYVLLLNNDTVTDKDFLKVLVYEGEKEKKVGLLGPKVYYYDNPNVIWCIGGKIDWKFARGINVGINEIDNGQYNKKKSFEYINGSAVLVKRKVFDNVGLLDKKFFLYFEEADLALRAAEKGFNCLYIPKAKIWHKVSRSGGGIRREIGLYYITRNRWIFMKKWAPKVNFLVFVPIQILMAIILPLSMSIYYKNNKLFLVYYKGLLDGLIKRI